MTRDEAHQLLQSARNGANVTASQISAALRATGDLPPITTGIRTIDDLMGRCRIDEFTGCWHWAAGSDGGDRPSMWFPALGRRVTLGTAIAVLLTGRQPAPGVVWHCTCSTPNCANPKHRTAGNRSTQMLAAKLQRDAATRSRIAAGKRAVSKLPEEAVEDIRQSTEPLRVVAERHHISIAHASNIRRGLMRRQLGAQGASVFNLGARPVRIAMEAA